MVHGCQLYVLSPHCSMESLLCFSAFTEHYSESVPWGCDSSFVFPLLYLSVAESSASSSLFIHQGTILFLNQSISFVVEFLELLIYSKYKSFIRCTAYKYLSHSLGCFFTLFTSFTEKDHLSLIQFFPCVYFCFGCLSFCVFSKKFLPMSVY